MRLLALLALVFVSPAARADVVISNLAASQDNSSVFFGPGDQYGVGFTTGPTAYTLDSVVARLEMLNPGDWPVTVGLYDNTGTNDPGAVVAAFAAPPFAAGINNYTFTPTAPFVLQPNTSYWLVLTHSPAATDALFWYGSDPFDVPTGAGATDFGFRFFDTSVPGWVNADDVARPAYTVNGTVVPTDVIPEPGTLAVLGLLGLGLGVARRRG